MTNILTRQSKIDFLVKRKFPFSLAPVPISMHGVNHYNRERHDQLLADVQAYKDSLSKKSQDEIQTLYEEEKAKEIAAIKLKAELEEKSRPFNLANANADFEHWSKAAHWTLDEAIALSFGKSPDIVSWEVVKQYINVSPFAKIYAARRDLALRAIPWKKLYDPMLPTIFLSWAKDLDIELPDDLISNVNKRLGIAIDWQSKYFELKTAYDNLKTHSGINIPQQDKVEATKYSTDLLNIQSLAISEFFNPRKTTDAKKNEVVEWVKAKGDDLKIQVSTNVAESIFTIIKPVDHNPKVKRG